MHDSYQPYKADAYALTLPTVAIMIAMSYNASDFFLSLSQRDSSTKPLFGVPGSYPDHSFLESS